MASNGGEKCVLSPIRLCHIVLRTTPERFKPMVDWWKKALGARAVWENEIICFMTYDDEHHRIAITGRPGTKPRVGDAITGSGLAHVAFAYDTLEDLTKAYRQRKDIGVLPSWCVNHGPTTSIYYADPDGNEMETQVDNFDTSDATTEYMNTPAFFENPMGVDFDPEVLIKRLESGESAASIKRRPDIGPRTSR
ncbi:hypothetical protein SLS56_000628 [Neofusicoccum ribis]|uniref:VOC domain-containing protein n=1 Tax=Neofusicoccum ribis TaxID=45134 RepID=A0ABR3TD30_9PEZI